MTEADYRRMIDVDDFRQRLKKEGLDEGTINRRHCYFMRAYPEYIKNYRDFAEFSRGFRECEADRWQAYEDSLDTLAKSVKRVEQSAYELQKMERKTLDTAEQLRKGWSRWWGYFRRA